MLASGEVKRLDGPRNSQRPPSRIKNILISGKSSRQRRVYFYRHKKKKVRVLRPSFFVRGLTIELSSLETLFPPLSLLRARCTYLRLNIGGIFAVLRSYFFPRYEIKKLSIFTAAIVRGPEEVRTPRALNSKGVRKYVLLVRVLNWFHVLENFFSLPYSILNYRFAVIY